MRVTVKSTGSFKNTENWLKRAVNTDFTKTLQKYGEEGVNALAAATPKDSGKTAASWRYEITGGRGKASITWCNDNVNDGVNIAVILQYGHGTGTGGYVQGTDYINPALKPVFEEIADEAWKELTRA